MYNQTLIDRYSIPDPYFREESAMSQPSQLAEELAESLTREIWNSYNPDSAASRHIKSLAQQAIQTAQAADKARILELEQERHELGKKWGTVQLKRITNLESTVLALSEALEEVKIHHDPDCTSQYCIWLTPHIVEFINEHNNQIDKALKAAQPTIQAARQRAMDEAIEKLIANMPDEDYFYSASGSWLRQDLIDKLQALKTKGGE